MKNIKIGSNNWHFSDINYLLTKPFCVNTITENRDCINRISYINSSTLFNDQVLCITMLQFFRQPAVIDWLI